MRIRLKKPHTFFSRSGTVVPAGREAEVSNELAKRLIEKGIAEPVGKAVTLETLTKPKSKTEKK